MDDTSKFHAVQCPARVRAVLVGERIDTATFERGDVISTMPFAYRSGSGIAVLFRYGVAVLVGLSPAEEQVCLQKILLCVKGPFAKHEEETATIDVSADLDDQIPPGGSIYIKSPSLERFLLIADALAKSVVLAHDEREVAAVFDIEPFVRDLAKFGRVRGGRAAILKRVGNALLVQQRVSGYVAIAEKPDALWDRPDLERLYARLEDEYELKERVDILNRKLAVISETAKVLTDIIDTRRSLRLEIIIVILIVFEAVIALCQIFLGQGH